MLVLFVIMVTVGKSMPSGSSLINAASSCVVTWFFQVLWAFVKGQLVARHTSQGCYDRSIRTHVKSLAEFLAHDTQLGHGFEGERPRRTTVPGDQRRKNVKMWNEEAHFICQQGEVDDPG